MNRRLRIIKEYYKIVSEERFKFFLSIILLIISTFCIIYAPILAGRIVNSFKQLNHTSLLLGVLFLFILYLLGFLLKLPSARFMSFVGEKSIYKLRETLYAKLNTVRFDLISSDSVGNLLARVNNDLMNIRSFITTSLSEILVDTIIVFIVIFLISTINIYVGLIFICSIPLYVLAFYFTDVKSKKSFIMHQETIGYLIGNIGDSLVNHVGIKAYNCEEYMEERFDKVSEEVNKNYKSSRLISSLNYPIINFIINLTTIGVYTYGVILLLYGDIALGTLLTILLFGKILNSPLKKISHYLTEFETALASFQRVLDIMELEDDVPLGDKILNKDSVKGDIEFKNISYKNIFKDFNFKVNSGDIVAITGAKAKGKTVLMELLLGLYKIDSGEIKLDGVNIYDIKHTDYKKVFGYVPQEKWIFKDTIGNNISYGMENPDISKVKEISKELSFDTLINALPENYDTKISHEKDNISDGELEYINIARALISNPKILILDNINIDISKFYKGKTVFIVTEDENIIKSSDKVIKL